MKYISSKTGGRLANQLYYVLQAYCIAKRTGIKCKYVQTQTICQATNLTPHLSRLNINQYVGLNKPIDHYLETHNYYQHINRDFTQIELYEFIKNTIVQSKDLKQYTTLDSIDTVAIHIRNGDYLKYAKFQVFNKTKYLQKALDCFSDCEHVVVYSDDNKMNQQQFDQLLKSKFKTVKYVSGNDEVTDILQLASYQNKILWNSTFSYWSGFISMVLHTNTKITCPNIFMGNEHASSRVLPNWIQL